MKRKTEEYDTQATKIMKLSHFATYFENEISIFIDNLIIKIALEKNDNKIFLREEYKDILEFEEKDCRNFIEENVDHLFLHKNLCLKRQDNNFFIVYKTGIYKTTLRVVQDIINSIYNISDSK